MLPVAFVTLEWLSILSCPLVPDGCEGIGSVQGRARMVEETRAPGTSGTEFGRMRGYPVCAPSAKAIRFHGSRKGNEVGK